MDGKINNQFWEIFMDEEIFNMQIRKFLKNVGVTSQREIETAVRAAINDGTLKGEETIQTKVTLSIESLGVSTEIDGAINLA
jgi:hypothetical protein